MLIACCPINREIHKIVSPNQGKSLDYNITNYLFSQHQKVEDDKYNIIVISRNIQIHQALENTLQSFSLNGKGINFFSAESLQDAQIIAEKHPDIILVIIDNNLQVNGSYNVFVDYIRKSLGNKICCIAFKENLSTVNSCTDDSEIRKDTRFSKFFYARERLVDITRMVMMTTEMESKINNPYHTDNRLDDGNIDYQDNSPQLTKDKLYNVMAKDLKEPLGNIKVMLDFLTNEPDLLDQQTSKDLLKRVKESAHSVHEMLEDYLFWSRMFKQEIYFNPGKADIGQICRENLVLLKTTAASKNIKLFSDVPEKTFALADEYMITTVVRNLLYNAIKFTQYDGTISISGEIKNEMIEIQVMDNGMGISRENLEKLFEADTKISTEGTEKESGSGLGLVLCKEFVERNGGHISVKSEPDVGSIIIFTLPVWSFAELT